MQHPLFKKYSPEKEKPFCFPAQCSFPALNKGKKELFLFPLKKSSFQDFFSWPAWRTNEGKTHGFPEWEPTTRTTGPIPHLPYIYLPRIFCGHALAFLVAAAAKKPSDFMRGKEKMSSFYDSVVVVFEMWSSKNEKWDKEKTCDLPEKKPRKLDQSENSNYSFPFSFDPSLLLLNPIYIFRPFSRWISMMAWDHSPDFEINFKKFFFFKKQKTRF